MAFLDLEKKDVMKALAREIAIAQLTAADELVDEGISTWTEDYKKRVPTIGDTDRRTGQPITQAQRYEIYRQNRASALAAVERERIANERAQQQMEQRRQEREAREAEQLEANRLSYDAAVAAHKARAAAAKAQGQAFNEPEPIKPPLTGAELAQAEYREYTRNSF